MLQEIFEQYIFFYVMAGIFLLGVISRIIVNNSVGSLLKASKQMELGKNKVLRSMEETYLNCYQLQVGVHNVDSFVDKHVYKLKKCGIFLYTWENICGQLYLYIGLVALISVVLGVINQCGINAILYHGLIGAVSAILLITMEKAANLPEKKQILKANIKDYLENYLAVACEGENMEEEVLAQYQEIYLNKAEKERSEKDRKKKTKKIKSKRAIKREEIEQLKAELAKELKEERRKVQDKYQKESLEKQQSEEVEMEELVESLKTKVLGQESLAATESCEEEKYNKRKKGITPAQTKTVQLNAEQEKIVKDILKEYLA